MSKNEATRQQFVKNIEKAAENGLGIDSRASLFSKIREIPAWEVARKF